MHRHGRASFPDGVPVILLFFARHSFSISESFHGTSCPGSSLGNPDTQIRYSPRCIRQRLLSVFWLFRSTGHGLRSVSTGKHTGFLLLSSGEIAHICYHFFCKFPKCRLYITSILTKFIFKSIYIKYFLPAF